MYTWNFSSKNELAAETTCFLHELSQLRASTTPGTNPHWRISRNWFFQMHSSKERHSSNSKRESWRESSGYKISRWAFTSHRGIFQTQTRIDTRMRKRERDFFSSRDWMGTGWGKLADERNHGHCDQKHFHLQHSAAWKLGWGDWESWLSRDLLQGSVRCFDFLLAFSSGSQMTGNTAASTELFSPCSESLYVRHSDFYSELDLSFSIEL